MLQLLWMQGTFNIKKYNLLTFSARHCKPHIILIIHQTSFHSLVVLVKILGDFFEAM